MWRLKWPPTTNKSSVRVAVREFGRFLSYHRRTKHAKPANCSNAGPKPVGRTKKRPLETRNKTRRLRKNPRPNRFFGWMSRTPKMWLHKPHRRRRIARFLSPILRRLNSPHHQRPRRSPLRQLPNRCLRWHNECMSHTVTPSHRRTFPMNRSQRMRNPRQRVRRQNSRPFGDKCWPMPGCWR